MPAIYDCIIIGGGIAGLTAAIYLARFHCQICVIDDKQSRASLIPKSHNFPGFPNGISGNEILDRLNEQFAHYQQPLVHAKVIKLKKNKQNYFTVQTCDETFHGRFIIYATGVVDIEPQLPNLKDVIKSGLVRHCLICDGFEVTNQKIAVLGNTKKSLHEAFFLKTYSPDVSLINIGKKFYFTKKEIQQYQKNKINIIEEPLHQICIVHNSISEIHTETQKLHFDVVYSALGVIPRTQELVKLGVKHTREKLIRVNAKYETSMAGIYAIGDIVPGLNQMSVAVGQAAQAALAIFLRLKNQ